MLPFVKECACINVNGFRGDSSHCSILDTVMNLHPAKSPLREKLLEEEGVQQAESIREGIILM